MIAHSFFLIIVAIYNGGYAFSYYLSAIEKSKFKNWELIAQYKNLFHHYVHQNGNHKAWNLLNLIKTDVLDRGIPWTRLLLSHRSGFMNNLFREGA